MHTYIDSTEWVKAVFSGAIAIVFVAAIISSAGCSADSSSQKAGQDKQVVTQDAPATETTISNVTAADAAELLNTRPDVIVLDIRTAKEYAQGHIENAILIDYYADDFKAQLAKLDKASTYLLHCRSGGRSGKTLPIMESLGFQKIVHLSGGFNDWKASNLPVAK